VARQDKKKEEDDDETKETITLAQLAKRIDKLTREIEDLHRAMRQKK